MIAPYLLRLVCVSLALFFVIHTVAGALVAMCGAAAVRAARNIRPRSAGRFLLALRLLPASLALVLVVGICVPSYLWLEPESKAEEVGIACLAAALGAVGIISLSLARGLRAATRTSRHSQDCALAGRRSSLPGWPQPFWILEAPGPLFALVGVFRPRVVISQAVIGALSPGQFDAALRHEESHRTSRDNLKRLVMLLTPGLLPGVNGFTAIERGWVRFSEWAADDAAAAGDAHRSLFLAAALVRIARMSGGTVPAPPLTSAFLGDSLEISARVDRLLKPAPAMPAPTHHLAWTAGGLACAAVCAAFMLNPVTLESAYRIIEEVIH